METTELDIPEVRYLARKKFSDARGFFCETFTQRDHPGIVFVQDNLSLSKERGTVRGLHYQDPPVAQTKLVTVLQGAIFDAAVDLRRGSPTFGRWVARELSAERLDQLLIPRGFAHGFCTLAPDTMVLYKVDAYYSPEHDRGVRWDDPAIGIAWPVARDEARLSDKDRRQPALAAIESPFRYL